MQEGVRHQRDLSGPFFANTWSAVSHVFSPSIFFLLSLTSPSYAFIAYQQCVCVCLCTRVCVRAYLHGVKLEGLIQFVRSNCCPGYPLVITSDKGHKIVRSTQPHPGWPEIISTACASCALCASCVSG